MKQIAVFRNSFIVALAIGTIVPAVASAALPEFVNSKGETLVKNKFTGKGGETQFETTGRVELTCSTGSISGHLTGTKTAEATLTFTGCETIGEKCSSKGAKAGEIVNTGKGKIVYSDKATKSVALLVEMEKGREAICGGEIGILLRGAIAGSIGPVNKSQLSFTNTWQQRAGVQQLTKYENEKGEIESAIWETKVGGDGWEQTGLEGEGTITLEEMGEIKA
jgi:hypothetical protein